MYATTRINADADVFADTDVRCVSGGSKGMPSTRAHYGPKFSQFHPVFGKFWQNLRLAPPRAGFAPPAMGNPGSASRCD